VEALKEGIKRPGEIKQATHKNLGNEKSGPNQLVSTALCQATIVKKEKTKGGPGGTDGKERTSKKKQNTQQKKKKT